MTKSQNTKDEQQKDLCITSEQLTEQWKKGELPDGFYWCDVDIYEDGNITKQIESFIHHHPVFYWETSIVRVIELTPSFSEYKSMQEENTKLKTENKWFSEQLNEAVKEVGQLKELLTMAREEFKYLRKHYKGSIDHLKNNTRLDKEIDQVLGEE